MKNGWSSADTCHPIRLGDPVDIFSPHLLCESQPAPQRAGKAAMAGRKSENARAPWLPANTTTSIGPSSSNGT